MSDKKVILDYAQEMQSNYDPWTEFQYSSINTTDWVTCTERVNPLTCSGSGMAAFRRKPKTITVTIPVPVPNRAIAIGPCNIHLLFNNTADRDTALAAIRDAMGGGE